MTAQTFPKFHLLPFELRHNIWEALWDSIEERTENLIFDCMQKGGDRKIADTHPEFATCAESRRKFIRLFSKQFLKTAERVESELSSRGHENSKPTELSCYKNECTFSSSFLFRTYATILSPESRVSVCACLIQGIIRADGADCNALWTIWRREWKLQGCGALQPFYRGTAEEQEELEAAEMLYNRDAVGSIS